MTEYKGTSKYIIGGVATAETIVGARKQVKVIERIAGRNPDSIHIVLRSTGEILTEERQDALLREEDS